MIGKISKFNMKDTIIKVCAETSLYVVCIPADSFNTNILRQLFNYKINNLCESQPKSTNSKGDFVLKNRFKTFVLKVSCIQK